MSAPHFAQTYLHESADLLAQIEEVALELEPGAAVGEPVHQLFRAFHTIKGSGAMFGFDAIAEFTHHVETVLDLVRTGALAISRELIDLILAAKDHIATLLEEGAGGAAVGGGQPGALVAALQALLPGQSRFPSAPDTETQPSAAAPEASAAAQTFRIRFRPPAEMMISGTLPERLLDELRGLGSCTVRADGGAVPPLEDLVADRCHLAWEIELTSSAGENAIRDVYMFVEDGAELAIECIRNVEPVVAPVAASPVRSESGAPRATGTPGAAPFSNGTSRKPAGTAGLEATVRVPAQRLDRLVGLVGELVMSQSRLSQVSAATGVLEFATPVEELERLVEEMRDVVLGIRMMPIGTTFKRFKRLVHDLALELGKEIDLVTEGAETELDKTVLDQIGDPLVHLIRNSIDHGIEPATDRLAAGKPRRGIIRLGAVHTGSNVVITIEDDGRGIDAAAVRAKAIERGLISPDAKLSEGEVFNLIFQPGFSTARQVSSVSGRGVGMDVVKKQLDALRGAIQLDSKPARGTRIALTLPLTLAIIEGLLVGVGGDQFILPMSAVLENVELSSADRRRHNGRNVVPVRGELVPYIRLREVFAIAGEEPAIEKVVIVRHGAERVGFVVDRVLGSHQTVIQSLGRFYRDISVLSGATIMGDGRVSLIIDVPGLVRFFESRPQAAAEP